MRQKLYMIFGLSLVWASALQAAPQFSEWSGPLATVPGGCPIESRDGNTLYTASASDGTLDIWAYQRHGRGGAFEDRTKLGAPVSVDDANDFCPTPLTGNWLMFVSNRVRPGTCGGSDMYLARYRPEPQQDFGELQHLACESEGGPNSSGMEFSPSVLTTPEGTFLYFSNNKSGTQKIYRSEMAPDGTYGPGALVTSLSVAGANDQQPNVGRDGLTIVFASNRDAATYHGGFDVFMATRASLADDWSTPRNLSMELAFPTAGIDETRPSLSWDLKRLYYGAGGLVHTSQRQPAGGAP